MSDFPSTFDTASLDGSNGFAIVSGIESWNQRSLASIGDINGDGFDDLLMGWIDQPILDADGTFLGYKSSGYVVFGAGGGPGGGAATVDIDALDGSNGFAIPSFSGDLHIGNSVTGLGDVNGDGIADFAIGSRFGHVYIVFGKTTGFDPSIDLAALDGSNGFKFASSSNSSHLVAGGGDINGDGVADIALTSDNNQTVYVIYGKDSSSSFNATIGAADLDGTAGFAITNPNIYTSVTSIDFLDDVNGDGFDDLAIGTLERGHYGYGADQASIVFGRSASGDAPFGATFSLDSIDGANGFHFRTDPFSYDYTGISVASLGDINGDGFEDIAIGDRGRYNYTSDPGNVYVVFGKNAQTSGDFATTLTPADLDGTNGFHLVGPGYDQAGYSVSSAGDINGDGFDDLLIGAPYANTAYVLFGKDTATAGAFAATIDLGSLAQPDGFTITASNGAFVGFSVSAAGDVNGDSLDDIAIFAGYDSGGRHDLAYVIYGSKFNQAPTAVSLSPVLSTAREDMSTLQPVKVADIVVTDDGEGTNLLALTGADADLFEISGTELYLKQGAKLDFETNPELEVSVTVDDPTKGSGIDLTSQSFVFTLTNATTEYVIGDAGDNTLTGADETDIVIGLDGNDRLDGGIGTDTLIGGRGNDTYVFSTGDTIIEEAGEGIDTVESAVTFALGANLENLVLTGNSAIKGTGNSAANVLTGNAAANTLSGSLGNDTMLGLGGNDTLVGGRGRDVMTGGSGKDIFDFNSLKEMGKTASTRDVIRDFAHLSDDIDLKTLDASTKAGGNQAFTFIGTQKFHKVAGELHYVKINAAGTANDKTIVEGDTNGDGRADFQIELTGLKTLSAADFVL
ncbi:MAG: hypothetical protein R3D57_17315 [Hyphomicrobiaceae bacterium]